MNLIEDLNKNINSMHLADFEKVRYIYLYCCQLFSFDTRYFYTSVWNDNKLRKAIESKAYNLENINDFLVICHTISKDIFKVLIEQLTSYKVTLNEYTIHSNIVIKTIDNPKKKLKNNLELDAAYGDLAKVKLGIKTYDYKGVNFQELDEIDKSLGFNLVTPDEYSNKISSQSYYMTLLKIMKVLEEYKFKHYSDAQYLYYDFAPSNNLSCETYLDRDYNFHKLIESNVDDRYFQLYNKNGYYQLYAVPLCEIISIQNSRRYKRKK